MRLTHVTIKNMRGLAHFDADLPAVALIDGGNEVGKSTLVDVIKYAAGRRVGPAGTRGVEHDPTMVHGDAEKGECVLTFDDPDGNLKHLKCVVTRGDGGDLGGTARYTKGADSTKFVRAGSDLDQYFDGLGYDPFKLIDMPPKERVENLLRILPSSVTWDEITAALGDVIPVPSTMPASIASVQALYDDIFAKRTDVNRDADTLQKQSELLDRAPGVQDETNWVETLETLRREKANLDGDEQDEYDRIQRTLNEHKLRLADERHQRDIAVSKDIDAKIAALQAERETKMRDHAAEMHDTFDAIRRTMQVEADQFIAANKPKAEALVTQIAEAETRAHVQIEAEGARKAAAHTKAQALAARAKSAAYTTALQRLQNLKSEAATRLGLEGAIIAAPRPGLPVDLCREQAGALVPFPVWNRADREKMALRIALKSQGRCGLVIVDSIGNFDNAAKEALKDTCQFYAAQAGVSFLVGTATEGPLQVKEWK